MANRPYDILVRLRDGVTARVRTMRVALRGVRDSLFTIRNAALAAGAALGAFAAARGIANFLGDAISSARSFEAQMATVRAVTGATTEEFGALSQAARDAGSSTRFTATEAAGGLEELSRAGFSAAESVQSLGSVLNFAQANAIGVADAATQITTSLNQFGLAADQSSRVADVLTKTAASSATNVQQLGNAMSYAAPLARQAGTSIEETAAIIGSLADQGFRGERAGTALRQAFALLQDPASKTARALEAAGISTRDFTEIIGVLERDADKAKQVLLSLPLEVRPAIAALVQQGSSRISELTGTLNEAAGATENAARIMDDNLDGALKNLGSAFESLKIELVTPLVKSLTTEIINLAERIREFTSSPAFLQLRQDLVQAFEDGTAKVKEFLREFDFQAATRSLGEFVRTTGRNVEKALAMFKALRSGAAVVANSFRLAFSAIDALTSSAVSGLAKIGELTLRIVRLSPAYREIFGDLSNEIQFFAQVSEDGYGRAVTAVETFGSSAKELAQTFGDLGGEADQATDAVRRSGKQADESKNFFTRLADGIRDTIAAAKKMAGEALEQANAKLGESGQAAAEATEKQRQLTEELKRQNPTLRDTGNEIQNVADQTGTWQKVLKILKGETEETGDETERTRDKTKELGDQSERTAQQVESAAGSFDKATTGAKGVAAAIGSIVGRYRELGGTVGEVGEKMVQQAAQGGNTILGFFRELGQSLGRVEEEYKRNAQTFDKWKAKLEDGEISARRFAQEIRSIGGETALLDKQRLDFFRAQLAQAKREAAELRREFIQLNDEIERDFLRSTGAEAELIRRDFDRREQQLRAAFEALTFQEQQAQRQEFQESLRRLEELEEKKLREIRERQKAERQGNEETHRQREADATEFHEDELGRAAERGRANAGAVANFNAAEEEARSFHERELSRINERKQAQIQAEREVSEAQRQIAGSGGSLAGARPVRQEIALKVIPGFSNGQALQLSDSDRQAIVEQLLNMIRNSRDVSGVRVVGRG